MPAYLVELPANARTFLPDGADTVVVYANSANDAAAMAQAKYTGDSDAAWAAATVTEIAAGADLEGFRLRVAVLDSSPVVDLTVKGAAAATVDSIAALMVTALNGTSIIAGAAYNGTSNTLTIAETTDGLGDKQVLVEFLPPVTFAGGDDAPLPDFVGAITDQGTAGSALTAVLGADTVEVPAFYASLKA